MMTASWVISNACENESFLILSSLWKNGNGNRELPEVTVVWSDRKWKHFWTGSQKYIFWKLAKNCLKGKFLVFAIRPLDGGRSFWSLFSGDVLSSPYQQAIQLMPSLTPKTQSSERNLSGTIVPWRIFTRSKTFLMKKIFLILKKWLTQWESW